MVWEASDRISGKRLKAALLHLVESMERHGHLRLDSLVKEPLLTASASTLDRLLKPILSSAGSRRRRGRRKSLGRWVLVLAYNDWNKPPPGYLEIDLVAHCGGPLSGSFIHSLVVTDVCTGWPDPNIQPSPRWPGTRAWSLRDWKPYGGSCLFPPGALTPTTTVSSSTRPC